MPSSKLAHRPFPLPPGFVNASLLPRQLRAWAVTTPSHPSSLCGIGSFLFIVSLTVYVSFIADSQSHIFGSRWRCRQKWKLCLLLHLYPLLSGGRGQPCVTAGHEAPSHQWPAQGQSHGRSRSETHTQNLALGICYQNQVHVPAAP